MTKVAGTAGARIDGLSTNKARLLEALVARKAQQRQRMTRLRRAPNAPTDRFPASSAQRRMWLINQFEGGGVAYHIPMVVRLRGVLDQQALQRALDAVVRRHESLRTCFADEDGEVMQVIARQGHFPLQTIDLSVYPEDERESQVQARKTAEAQAPFELRAGPLIRGQLLRLGVAEHVLMITPHHIIFDGWSMRVLAREVAGFYRAYHNGHEASLQPLTIQYADYAQWQRQWLQGEVLDRQLSYWRKHLTGAAPQLELPADRPRPVVQSYRGANVRVALGADFSAALKAFAEQQEMTLFMVMYAAWAILLSRLSGQEDVVIGTPIANRQRNELEGIIGFFVNTLVLRVEPRAEMQITEFLRQVKEVTLSGYDHQDVPFDQIVDALQPPRSLSRNPLFQVMLDVQSAQGSELRLPGIATTVEERLDEPAKFDLLLVFEDHGNDILGNLSFATDLFDIETVERWMASLTVLLKEMTARPYRRIGEMPIMTESQRDRVINLFNPPPMACPHTRLIHESFELQVAKRPEAIALSFEGQDLSYAELNQRANQLAHYLVEKGVGPDQLVGICVARDLQMVVGLLAILKAGGAYVPLDPNYPAERLAYMLADAAPKVVLTQQSLRERLPDIQAHIVALDKDWDVIAEKPTSNLDRASSELRPHHLAYVIYTSGSTGQPKGVMVEHRNVTRLFATTEPWFGFNERDVWTLFHSFAFDFSVWELWGALLYGGRVVVVPYLTARAPQDFYRLLCREGVTVLNQTPSAFANLIDAQANSSEQHSLRVVIFGGEALELRMLRPWIRRNGAQQPQLINMYGITETTVHVTYRALSQEEIESGRGSPIGTPIPDLRAYLLDRSGQPVPIGVIGEMYIGGGGVARGYLNRSELTQERFLRDPFSPDAQARMYKTGDLGRWRPDGTIEYLGRNDHQVKIRGFRIELGEIEMQLARHPQVKEVAVIAREDEVGDKRLVAYVIPTVEVPSVESLRSHLQSSLPEHMVPSAFVILERFPLTSNGKLDRAALPLPDEHAVSMRQYVPPRTELEQKLCSIWEEVLGLGRVGIEDNFFAIGGDSILSLRILARAQASGVNFAITDLFSHQSIEQLAGAIEAGGQQSPPTQRVTVFGLLDAAERAQFAGVASIVDAYPLSQLQEGMYFHSESAPHSAVYHDVFAYSVEAAFNREHFEYAVQSLIARHPVLRTGFTTSCAHRLVQVVHRSASAQVVVEDISQLNSQQQDQHIREWIDREKFARFDWAQPPLLRVFVHLRAPDRFESSLSFHHAIFDGWSIACLQTELFTHYFSLLAGKERVMEPPAAMYRDFIARERQALQSVSSQEYWKNRLAGASLLTLPRLTRLRHRAKGRQVETYAVSIDPKIGAGLESRAQQLRVHLKSLLLAAHVKVMSAISGENIITTGVVSHGRLEDQDGERVLGLHLNSLPLHVDVDAGSWKELILRLRAVEEEMFPHRYYPLAAIHDLIRSEQLIDTLFNFTRFHVYKQIDAVGKVTQTQGFEQTNFSLLVNFSQQLQGSGLELSMSFDPAVLGRAQVERMSGYYQKALKAIVADLDAGHYEETLLSAAETDELLVQFNGAAAPFPSLKKLHGLFEEQAKLTPRALAVVHGGQSATYAEINSQANRLARYLMDRGVGADRLVGICLERGVEMIVGLLGILKAGGAYVPMDPNYPAERLQHMLEDAAPRVVLTQAKLRSVLPQTQAELIDVARVMEIDSYPDTDLSAPENSESARDLVYVIYTSGSTGRPKGTAMSHRSMTNLIEWHRRNLPLGEQKKVLQFAALSFDVAFQETFSTLCTGGTLVMVDEDVRRDSRALVQLLNEQGVARLFVPPLMLQSLAEYFKSSGVAPASLRDVITAGEQLHITTEIANLFKHLEGCKLHNHYGPTETHVVTALTLTGDPGEWPAFPSIGRPLPNLGIYVLNRQLQPVPVGVAGEVYIGGAGVAQGYLGRPELTAQRFLADPFGSEPGALLYKTGDLARWQDDGQLEYLGRNDDQVKIRGYRVELGEIEAHLARHSQVKEASVIAGESGAGGRRLIAYFTCRDSANATSEDLRAYLQGLMPEYMVPSAFVCLPSMPLTPSGKLNRRALPAPDLGAFVKQEYQAPQGQVEQTLAGIWQELLKIDQIGRQDNFFSLGGHSLLVLKALFRISESFGRELKVTDVYQSPTIRELAVRIAGGTFAEEFVDLAQEAALAGVSVESLVSYRIPARTVLLTGATGFVGRFLLAQLLRDTEATICCLVRVPSQREAMSRLKDTMIRWDLWREEFEQRVMAIHGDLRAPRLGIDDAGYEFLCRNVDSIYHCATSMNHLETYAMARPANVGSARELLTIATSHRKKVINFISSLGVFSALTPRNGRAADETTSIDRELHSASSGYLASKWVGEKIFLSAQEAGVPCNIFRLGFVWADTGQGRYDELQRDYRVFKSCMMSGYGIENYRYELAPTPVDYAARAMVFLADRHCEGRGVFHICASKQAITGVFERCNEIAGLALELKSHYDWTREMKRLHEEGMSLPVVPLIDYTFSMDEPSFREHQQAIRTASMQFDCTRTRRELADAGIVEPLFDDTLLLTFVNDMVSRDAVLGKLMPGDKKRRADTC